MNWIEEYRNEIARGRIVVPRRIIQAYDRLGAMLERPTIVKTLQMDGSYQDREYVYSEEHAERPIAFIEQFCKQSLGQSVPLKLELFQKAKLAAIFGIVDSETGMRLCREAHTYEGRKNGKTTEQAALGLEMMVADGESGPQIVCLATKRDQARMVFDEASRMVAQSPDLRKVIKQRKSDLYSRFNFGTYAPLASEARTLDGLNPHFISIDELHAILERNLYDVVKQATTARSQSLLSIITTAGLVRDSIYDTMYELDVALLDGLEGFEEPSRFVFLYELDNIDEWTDYHAWQKPNPGLGTIKSFADLATLVARAKVDATFLPTVLTKDFNMRQTESGSWLTYQLVDNPETFDIDGFRDCYAVGGADLSSTQDLTCATVLIEKGRRIYVLQRYFIPEDLVERKVREDRVPYDIWAQRGHVTLCPGSRIDYSMVTKWFVELREQHGIYTPWVGYDSWGAAYWVKEMEAHGFVMERVIQGAKTMSQPMKELEADFYAKRVVYNNHPILKWCLTNTRVEVDDNANMRPIKGRNSKMRIDGTVSLIDAYVVYLARREDYRTLQKE